MKLPKKFKAKWLKALRSGEYKQTEGMLYRHSEDSFCCLGVGCHLFGQSKKSLRGTQTQNTKAHNRIPKYYNFGLDYQPLSSMNDNGQSFKQIANYIEKNL